MTVTEELVGAASIDGVEVSVTWTGSGLRVDGPTAAEAAEWFDALDAMGAPAAESRTEYPLGVYVPDGLRRAIEDGSVRSPEDARVALECIATWNGPPVAFEFSWPRRERPPKVFFYVAAHIPPLRYLLRRSTAVPVDLRHQMLAPVGVPRWMVVLMAPRWWLVCAGLAMVVCGWVYLAMTDRSVAALFGLLPVVVGGPSATVIGGRMVRRLVG